MRGGGWGGVRASMAGPSASEGAPGAMLSGDQVWLEELVDPMYCQSSSSQASGPGYSGGGSESSSSENSWSSGATSVLRSSIKKHSQEAFRSRLGAARCRKSAGRPSVGPQVEQGGGASQSLAHAWPEGAGLSDGRSSAHSCSGSSSGVKLQQLEDKVEAKLRFSKFLDEVTSNVFDTNSLQAFGKAAPRPGEGEEAEWSPRPLCSMALRQASLPELKTTKEEQGPLRPKTYLETDIDTVREDGEPRQQGDGRDIIPPPPQFCQGFEMTGRSPDLHCHFPRFPYKSVSLPRGINMVSDESLPSL